MIYVGEAAVTSEADLRMVGGSPEAADDLFAAWWARQPAGARRVLWRAVCLPGVAS